MDDIKGPGRIKFFWLSFITLQRIKNKRRKFFVEQQEQRETERQ